MGRGRVTCWKAPAPAETTVALAAVLQPEIRTIVEAGIDFYTHRFAATDADKAVLRTYKALLNSFRELDGRGSFFAQADMVGAVKNAIDANDQAVTVRAHADSHGMDTGEFAELIALKIRAVCTHERLGDPGKQQDL